MATTKKGGAAPSPKKSTTQRPVKKVAAKRPAGGSASSAMKEQGKATNAALVSIVAGAADLIPIDLVGVRYEIHRPKSIVAMRSAQIMSQLESLDEDDDDASMEMTTEVLAQMDRWIDQVFGKSMGQKIQDRLNDPEDSLDFDHIMELLGALPAAVSGDPTS